MVIETSDITRYFEEMRIRLDVVEKAKEEIDRLVAPDFNLFSILRPDEVRLSKMIACLLDPSESHGQGSKFLHAFLDMLVSIDNKSPAALNLTKIKEKWTASKNIKSKIEQTTDMIEASQRRMDILVSDDGVGLMIENKPWALDQEDQIPDYGEHMAKRFQNFAMIYLSREGAPPEKVSFTKEGEERFDERVRNGHFLPIAYRPHLVKWLQRCLDLVEADRVRWIIKDFIAYIETSFPISKPSQSEAQ